MRWSRDAQSPLGARLRSLLVLGLVVALVAEIPLGVIGGMPTWLTLGGTSTAVGSVLPLSGEPGAPVLAPAKKHKRDKQKADKPSKDKSDKQGKPGKDHAGKKGKDHAGKNDKDKAGEKGTHQGAGKGKHKSKGDKPGKNEGTQDRKRKVKSAATGRIAAADVTTAAAPVTIAPYADAQVAEDQPEVNYGTLRRLAVDGGGDDPNYVSYLSFDVSGVAAPVQRATLRLWVRGNQDNGTKDGPEVRTTSTDWTETGITWNTQPAPASSVLDNTERLERSTWVEYDVTRAVSGDGSVAFVLLPESRDGVSFASREGDHQPELVIAIMDDTQTPTPEPSPTSTAEPDPTATPEPTAEPTAEPTSTAVPTPTPEATPTPTPPTGESATLLAAGDIAGCSTNGDEATAALLEGLAGTVATLGDNAYESGTASEFSDCYAPTWGRAKDRTRPALGNHEYQTSGASGYFGYFDPQVQSSYYSYELGSWHIVVLDSNCFQVGGCGAGSPQEQWLRQDLQDHPTSCTLAYWHHPRFSFGNYSNDSRTQALWRALDDAGAEIVLSGHDHNYQRWKPLNGAGDLDPNGIRQFVVGTGGRSHYALGTPPANVEKSNGDTFGVLQLTLQATGYDWQFIPVAGESFTDTGSGTCH
jgi:hypothetical protein